MPSYFVSLRIITGMSMHPSPTIARQWFPCVDSPDRAFTAEFEITVDYNMVAVCTGSLVSQHCDEARTWRRFSYSISSPTVASGIVVNVAPYIVVPDPNLPNVTYFCLPGKESLIRPTTSVLAEIKAFLERYLGEEYSHPSFNLIFDEGPVTCELAVGPGLAIMREDLMHRKNTIEEALESGESLAFLFACAWFQALLPLKSWRDVWIHMGLAGFLRDLFFREKLGENEHKLRIRAALNRVAKLDVHMAPLCPENITHPAELFYESALIKATVVFHMLERRTNNKAFQGYVRSLLKNGVESGRTSISTQRCVHSNLHFNSRIVE